MVFSLTALKISSLNIIQILKLAMVMQILPFTDTFSEKAAIIEIKTTTVVSDLIDLSQEAVEQIEEKHYADPFKANKMVQSIYAYGIAFAGKNCFITCKKLKSVFSLSLGATVVLLKLLIVP